VRQTTSQKKSKKGGFKLVRAALSHGRERQGTCSAQTGRKGGPKKPKDRGGVENLPRVIIGPAKKRDQKGTGRSKQNANQSD